MKYQEIWLSDKQKLILNVLKDEFHGEAYTKEMLEESEDLREISMPQLTWALNQMTKMSLLNKEKGFYKGKEYTSYFISDFIKYDAVIIK